MMPVDNYDELFPEFDAANQTHHLDKRIKQRTGLPKKSHPNFLKRVVNFGLRVEDVKCKSKIYNYLKSITKEGYYIVVYNIYIVVFTNSGVGITILYLPKEYHRIADDISHKRNEVCANG